MYNVQHTYLYQRTQLRTTQVKPQITAFRKSSHNILPLESNYKHCQVEEPWIQVSPFLFADLDPVVFPQPVDTVFGHLHGEAARAALLLHLAHQVQRLSSSTTGKMT